MRGVFAPAIMTILGPHRQIWFRAAVAAVPVTTFFVIAIIAGVITLVLGQIARTRTTGRVQTFALLTVNVLVRVVVMTTITTIPTAFLIVVLVITVCVSLAFWAFAIRIAMTTVASAFEDVLESRAFDTMLTCPFVTGSVEALVLLAFVYVFVKLTLATTTVAPVVVFQSVTR